MDSIVIEEDDFKVRSIKDGFRFHYGDSKIDAILAKWRKDPRYSKRGEPYASHYLLDGYTKEETINTLNYFKECGINLSLETELWIANNKRRMKCKQK